MGNRCELELTTQEWNNIFASSMFTYKCYKYTASVNQDHT